MWNIFWSICFCVELSLWVNRCCCLCLSLGLRVEVILASRFGMKASYVQETNKTSHFNSSLTQLWTSAIFWDESRWDDSQSAVFLSVRQSKLLLYYHVWWAIYTTRGVHKHKVVWMLLGSAFLHSLLCRESLWCLWFLQMLHVLQTASKQIDKALTTGGQMHI